MLLLLLLMGPTHCFLQPGWAARSRRVRVKQYPVAAWRGKPALPHVYYYQLVQR
jgi:hypothetical protein